jgi:hypothetical protein
MMRGDTIDTERFVQHCLDTESQAQKWVRWIIRQPNADSRIVSRQFPAVKISEGYGITTYAYHSGGGIHTMRTDQWEALPRRR